MIENWTDKEKLLFLSVRAHYVWSVVATFLSLNVWWVSLLKDKWGTESVNIMSQSYIPATLSLFAAASFAIFHSALDRETGFSSDFMMRCTACRVAMWSFALIAFARLNASTENVVVQQNTEKLNEEGCQGEEGKEEEEEVDEPN